MEYKQAIILRADLKLGKGKLVAQGSHASISAYDKAKLKYKDWAEEWLPFQKKIVLKVDSKEDIVRLFQDAKKELPCSLIKDAGRTQIEAGTITAIAIGPAPDDLVNKYVKDLKLM